MEWYCVETKTTKKKKENCQIEETTFKTRRLADKFFDILYRIRKFPFDPIVSISSSNTRKQKIVKLSIILMCVCVSRIVLVCFFSFLAFSLCDAFFFDTYCFVGITLAQPHCSKIFRVCCMMLCRLVTISAQQQKCMKETIFIRITYFVQKKIVSLFFCSSQNWLRVLLESLIRTEYFLFRSQCFIRRVMFPWFWNAEGSEHTVFFFLFVIDRYILFVEAISSFGCDDSPGSESALEEFNWIGFAYKKYIWKKGVSKQKREYNIQQ